MKATTLVVVSALATGLLGVSKARRPSEWHGNQ